MAEAITTRQDLYLQEEIVEAVEAITVVREASPPVTISVNEGVVTLAGNVMTRPMGTMMLRAAASVPGVVRVLNHLAVDTDIDFRLGMAYAAAGLPSVLIKTYRGVVTLLGTVSAAEKDKMLAVTRETFGVRSVIDHLTVE
jgi:osmotically-inducible protein OsmY